MFEEDVADLKPCSYLCHACERGACVATCADQPRDCVNWLLKKYDGNEDVEPVWKRVYNIADHMKELMDWGEFHFTDCASFFNKVTFPDWFYGLVSGGGRVDRSSYYALENVLNEADGVSMPYVSSEEKKKAFKKYKKDEIAETFASIGFGYGLLYGEWRKRLEDRDSFELIEDY